MSTLGWRKGRCSNGHIDPPRYKTGACIPCSREKALKRYANDKQAMISRSAERNRRNPEARRDEQRAWRLGLSVAEVRSVISTSGMCCGACGKTLTHATLCIDHDHLTGRIRGVLCRFCNALEGMLTKQVGRVGKLLDYLKRCDADVNWPEMNRLDDAITRLKRGELLF